MKTSVTKSNWSSYSITVDITKQDHDTLHQKTLQSLQWEVKIPGFRPWHVPLHMVEKQIQPQYLKMAFLEEAINASIKIILKEHADKQFIGQPYDINQEEKGEMLVITYKLDTYPEVIVKNTDRKKLTIPAIDTTVDKKDTEQAITNLQKQYADYKDADVISKTTLVKASYKMNDKDGNELHKWTAFFGEEEMNESALLLGAVEGKKKGDVVEFPYKEKELPHAVHYHPHGSELAKKIKHVVMTIVDIKETIMPNFEDEATLTRIFQSPDIKTYDALIAKVKDVLIEQKEQQGLQEWLEKLLIDAKDSLEVTIPETFIKEEMSARTKQLGDRMGWEEGLKQYFEKIGEQKVSEMYDDIRKSAQESLEKFFMLRKFVELLEITDVNWDNQLDIERKIYGKLSSWDTKKKASWDAKKKVSWDAEKETSSDDNPTKKTTRKKKTDETGTTS